MVKRKKADIDIFLNDLSTKILNNEHGSIKETIDEKTGICTKVEVSGMLEVYPDKIEYKGVAITAKEDMDFATILVGQNIALMRAQVDILNKMREKETSPFIFMKITSQINLLEKELQDYINLKDAFFVRLRNTRKDPNFYKIQHLSIDEEGKVSNFGTNN